MTDVGGIEADSLSQYIERIERLEHEKAEIATAVREIYAEAKSRGLDPKVMRQIVRSRKMDKDELDQQETLYEVYKKALGMIASFEESDSSEAA